MKKIFLDTNFIIDYFIREGQDGPCEQLLIWTHNKRYQCYISFLTVANFAYIARKMPKEIIREMIENICDTFEVIDNTEHQLLSALKLNSSDFEDAIQYFTAKDAKCDYIITRNQKDFNFSDIPALSAREFIETVMDK